MLTEFRKFIARGNVLELAVGVIIGAAFGKITTSLTESILMPLLGWLFGDIDFSRFFIRLGEIPADFRGDPANYAQLKAAGVAMIGYGNLITQLINFLIIAFALFLIVRSANRVIEDIEQKQKDAADTSQEPEVPTNPELDVLKDILAELRKGHAVTSH